MEGDPAAREPVPEASQTPDAPRLLCGAHPERDAVATCSRCGTYVCEGCARDDGMTGRMCPDCAPRHARSRIAWETPSVAPFPDGYVRTMRAVILDAPTFFGKLPDGRWTRPATFFAVTWFGVMLLGGVVKLAAGANDAPAAFVAAPCSTPLAPLAPSLYAVVLFGIAYVLGGRGSLRETTRATLYAAPLLLPVWVSPDFSVVLPRVVAGGLSVVAYVVGVLLGARALAWYFRGRMGMTGLRAWLAALAPPGLFLGSACGLGLVLGLLKVLHAGHAAHGH